MVDRRGISRFLRYSAIGAGTFAGDLLLLFVLTELLDVHYLGSAAISFLIAISCNYALSRKYIFAETKRSHSLGYVNFLLIAGIGLCFVTGSMFVLVNWVGLNYLFSRVMVAGITGIWNYLMNLFVNFKVAGDYTEG
jgi:putative flippase GtrA